MELNRQFRASAFSSRGNEPVMPTGYDCRNVMMIRWRQLSCSCERVKSNVYWTCQGK